MSLDLRKNFLKFPIQNCLKQEYDLSAISLKLCFRISGYGNTTDQLLIYARDIYLFGELQSPYYIFYGSESWSVKIKYWKRRQTAEMRILRFVSCCSNIRNKHIWAQLGIMSLNQKTEKVGEKWKAHLPTTDATRIPEQVI
jgi:hypothetical protein